LVLPLAVILSTFVQMFLNHWSFMARSIYVLLALISLSIASVCSAQTGGAAAAFARLGFSARGIALGNAANAVITDGELHPYYNPAAVGFAEFYNATAAYTFLSFDRRLNFISFTGKIGPTAGVGASFINSGVGNIDGRNRDGEPTGTLSTSENLFMLSFANKFIDELSVGITLRGYLASLSPDIPNSFTIGFDVGAIYRIALDSLSSVSIGASVADVSSNYRWDTTPIYGTQGATTIDRMPLALRFGAAWQHENTFGLQLLLLSTDVQFLSQQFEGRRTTFTVENGIPRETFETSTLTRSEIHLRFGAMLQPIRQLKFRVGIDRLGIQGIQFFDAARPAIGFSFEYPIEGALAVLDYTFSFEPNSAGVNLISLGARF
jgi:hypothetical protein